MTIKFLYYKNRESLFFDIENQQSFYLIFDINTGSDKYLKQIVRLCTVKDHFKGVVFRIVQSRFEIDKLFYLKDLIEELLAADKLIGMWGVPACVPRTLLGGYLYMRFINQQIPHATKTKLISDIPRAFAPICKPCIDKNTCIGPGDIDLKAFKPTIKKNIAFSVPYKSCPFDSNLVFLNRVHDSFVDYCLKEQSLACYRSVYYVSNIDFKSEHSYADRFVYGCDYINPDEYKKEFEFLRSQVINTRYINLLESIASIEKTSQIAYSLAQKGTVFRESFYMFVSKQYGDKVLQDFHIQYNYPKSSDMKCIGVGLDVINDRVECYKLYFQSSRTFLKPYLEPFGVDMTLISHNSHYLVLRLDKQQNLSSYKVEILIRYEDLKCFKSLIDDYEYYDEKLKSPGLYNIAIEIVETRISKINVYHRNNFLEESQ